MKILVSGSNGMIGSALVKALQGQKHDVHRLVRSGFGHKTISWNPITGTFDRTKLEDTDVVIHLAGESIASDRWTPAKKMKIRDSRVVGTRHLAKVFAGMTHPPSAFICASAIGYYGDRKGENLDESSGPGKDFLAGVCQEWEAATQELTKRNIRVVNLRFGIILTPHGGALKKMLPPFKMGLGGPIGDGKQYMSWIAFPDVLRSIEHVIQNEKIKGPINIVSPSPVTNKEFTQTLAKVLGRPALFPMPAFMARFMFGEMADALLLSSARVIPKKLNETDYKFRFRTLESALRALLAG